MEKRNHRKLFIACLLVVSACLMLSNAGFAAEFSADTVTKASGQTMTGKVFVKGDNFRQEMDAMGRKQITIMRKDLGLTWVLMPDAHMYMEMKTSGGDLVPQRSPEEIAKTADKKYIGEERINGYACKKYRYTFNNGQSTMFHWISTKLQFPIKVEMKGPDGHMLTEYRNIKETKVSKSLFELPPGYQKMSIPGMPKMPGMPGASQ
jgi:outer membrane lipoprotein-sorting protein